VKRWCNPLVLLPPELQQFVLDVFAGKVQQLHRPEVVHLFDVRLQRRQVRVELLLAEDAGVPDVTLPLIRIVFTMSR